MGWVSIRQEAARHVRACLIAGVLAALVACGDDAPAPMAPAPPDPPPVDTTPPTPPADTTTTPTQPSSDVSFPGASATSLTLAWTSGNGAQRLVVMREGAAVDTGPADGSVYAADSVFGAGDELGSGNYAVFNGTGNGVTIVGLTPQLEYHVAVYEYNGDSTETKYLAATTASASQMTPAVPSLIGSWLEGTAGAQLSSVVTFINDTLYMVVDDGIPDSDGMPGMERGSYTWDGQATGSGTVTASPTTDTNGGWGFSVIVGGGHATIRGDTLILGDSLDTVVATRVATSDASSPLVGAWLLQDPADPLRTLVLTILDDSNYMLGADDTPSPSSGPGLERGTYTWDPASGAFTSTTVTDTNGTLGLNPLINSGTATVSGDTLTYVSNGGPIALLRIRPPGN